MAGILRNWTAAALAVALGSAVISLFSAFFAREGAVFAAAVAAGSGTLAAAAYAALALQAAERRIAKLSDEMTVLSQRLVRLETRPAAPEPRIGEIEELARATGALADALDGQDARLRSLEARDEKRETVPPAATIADVGTAATSPDAGIGPASPPVTDAANPLRTREDFARAASAILGRLAQAPSAPPVGAPPAPAIPAAPSEGALLAELEAGRLEMWIRPIVTLPQRRARLYLAVPHLRGEDGSPVGPDIHRPILARRRRLARLDAFALSQSLAVASHLAARGSETAVCLPLSREALATPAFVEGAASRLAEDPGAAAQFVVAVDHAETEAFSAAEAAALERFRSLGTGLAIAALPGLDRDWGSLSRRGFDFAMLPVETILGPRPHTTTAFLVAEAARAGIALAATGVEEERQVPDLLDFDVPLAAGSAIAPARAVRAELLAPVPERAPEPEPDGPTPFRDFLRRVG